MAKHTGATVEKPGFIARIKQFLNEVKDEMRKVTWPSREEVKGSTQVVLGLLLLVSFLIGIYDVVFQRLLIVILGI